MYRTTMKSAAAVAAGICLTAAVIAGNNAEARPGKSGMPRPPAPNESWKNPIDPHTGQVNYNWMLMSAVIHSDMEYIQKALDNGADINQKSGNGTTPLHEAIFNLDLEVVSYLIERKADLNILNRWGYSPLAWCYEVQGSDEELAPIAAALKKVGAKEIVKDTGEPPPFPWSKPTPETLAQYNANILFCAQQPNCDLGMLNRFLKKGADPNTSNSQGIPAIVFGILRGNEGFVKLLVENRADVNRLSAAGSPLANATYYGNMNMVKLLVENGAKLDVPDNGEFNPLMQAFQRNHFEVVRYLIDQGANTRVTGHGNKGPIHYAAGSGDMKLAKLLIKKGADIMATDDGGWDAMIHAAWGENGEMVDYLTSLGADINRTIYNEKLNLLHMTLRGGSRDARKKLQFLLSKGIDVNAKDSLGFTPLFYSLFYGNPDEFAEMLIRAGADVNAESGDGYTVLCRAFIEGRDSIGDLLIKSGADINKKNKNGSPMTVLCAEQGYIRPLKAFIARKADLNAVDAGGRTALHAAAQAGKKDIYNLLLKSKARRDIRDRNGRTAAEYLKK
ncbi:MAG TPA: ankyrin repeat domain-containing protein [Spirochaetota bacterium]|nr:ankyrin repeat domain-containing protein [Spirochaetota bacterium]HQH96131.1 ankyrin repeat domain-containing protein [Spirochaetota bacterium]HQJ69307.1 ankyrin repeat domain-containing protein [Spirochaetota bacterium]